MGVGLWMVECVTCVHVGMCGCGYVGMWVGGGVDG